MKKTSREEWRKRVNIFLKSRQTQKAWSDAHNISPKLLSYWVRQFRKESANNKPQQWLPVNVSEEENILTANSLTVKVGKISVEVKDNFDPQLLLKVVKVLESIC